MSAKDDASMEATSVPLRTIDGCSEERPRQTHSAVCWKYGEVRSLILISTSDSASYRREDISALLADKEIFQSTYQLQHFTRSIS